MENQSRKVLSGVSILLGLFLILNSSPSITGFIIIDTISGTFSSILGMAFIIVGMIFFIAEIQGESELEKAIQRFDLEQDRGYEEQSDKAYKRFIEVRDFLKRHNDNEGIKLINGLIKDAGEYIMVVAEAESLKDKKHNLREDKYVRNADRVGLRRTRKHNALLSQLMIVNRYLFKNYTPGKEIPYGGICSLPLEALDQLHLRVSVGDWAGYIINGIYSAKKGKK